MNRTFWRGFLLGSLVFGLLGMWVSPRRGESWEDRRRAVARGAAQLMRASRRSAGELARAAGEVGRSAGNLARTAGRVAGKVSRSAGSMVRRVAASRGE